MSLRCPGQNMQNWKPEDISDGKCPFCDADIEFWKDEPIRICRNCGKEVRNPNIDLACAEWCKFASECLASLPEDLLAALPVVDRLSRIIEKRFGDSPESFALVKKILGQVETIAAAEGGDPCLVRVGALLAATGIAIGKNLTVEECSEILDELEMPQINEQAIPLIIAINEGGEAAGNRELAMIQDGILLVKLAQGDEKADEGELLDDIQTSAGKALAEKMISRK